MSYRVTIDEEIEDRELAEQVYNAARFLVEWGRRQEPRPLPLRVRLLRPDPDNPELWQTVREEMRT